MNDDKEPFRLRLVYRDHIMIKPDSQLDLRASFIGRPLTRAPVIRLFGVTPASQRACLLVHRYMPYFYVDLHGTGLPAVGESNDVFLARFAQLVDDCLQGSIQNNNNTDDIASNQRAFVADMSMDLATPFYGYHESQHTFVKISLADPSLIKRAANLLMSGAVLGKSFTPYEAHIPFELKFFADCNIAGMNFVDIDWATFRGHLPESLPVPVAHSSFHHHMFDFPTPSVDSRPSNGARVWLSSNTPQAQRSSIQLTRLTDCELEADIEVSQIRNPRYLTPIDLQSSSLTQAAVSTLSSLRGAAESSSTNTMSLSQKSFERRPIELSHMDRIYSEQLAKLAALDAAKRNGDHEAAYRHAARAEAHLPVRVYIQPANDESDEEGSQAMESSQSDSDSDVGPPVVNNVSFERSADTVPVSQTLGILQDLLTHCAESEPLLDDEANEFSANDDDEDLFADLLDEPLHNSSADGVELEKVLPLLQSQYSQFVSQRSQSSRPQFRSLEEVEAFADSQPAPSNLDTIELPDQESEFSVFDQPPTVRELAAARSRTLSLLEAGREHHDIKFIQDRKRREVAASLGSFDVQTVEPDERSFVFPSQVGTQSVRISSVDKAEQDDEEAHILAAMQQNPFLLSQLNAAVDISDSDSDVLDPHETDDQNESSFLLPQFDGGGNHDDSAIQKELTVRAPFKRPRLATRTSIPAVSAPVSEKAAPDAESNPTSASAPTITATLVADHTLETTRLVPVQSPVANSDVKSVQRTADLSSPQTGKVVSAPFTSPIVLSNSVVESVSFIDTSDEDSESDMVDVDEVPPTPSPLLLPLDPFGEHKFVRVPDSSPPMQLSMSEELDHSEDIFVPGSGSPAVREVGLKIDSPLTLFSQDQPSVISCSFSPVSSRSVPAVLKPAHPPPSAYECVSSLDVAYQAPFYSDPRHIHKPVSFAGRTVQIGGPPDDIRFLKPFESLLDVDIKNGSSVADGIASTRQLVDGVGDRVTRAVDVVGTDQNRFDDDESMRFARRPCFVLKSRLQPPPPGPLWEKAKRAASGKRRSADMIEAAPVSVIDSAGRQVIQSHMSTSITDVLDIEAGTPAELSLQSTSLHSQSQNKVRFEVPAPISTAERKPQEQPDSPKGSDMALFSTSFSRHFQSAGAETSNNESKVRRYLELREGWSAYQNEEDKSESESEDTVAVESAVNEDDASQPIQSAPDPSTAASLPVQSSPLPPSHSGNATWSSLPFCTFDMPPLLTPPQASCTSAPVISSGSPNVQSPAVMSSSESVNQPNSLDSSSMHSDGLQPRLGPQKPILEAASDSALKSAAGSMSGTDHINQHLRVLSIEVLCASRDGLLPNPLHDSVQAIAYCLRDDDARDPATYAYTDASGLLLNLPSVNAARVFPPRANPTVAEFAAHRVPSPRLGLPTDVAVAAFDSELWCLAAFVHLIRTLDPDIVVGFEVQKSSFGYLIDRYAALTRSTTRPPEFIPRGLPPRPPAAPAPAQNFSSAYAGGLGSAGLSNAQSNRPPSSTPVEVNYFTAKLSRELPARVDEYYDNVTRGFGKRGGADIWSDTHGAGLVVAGRIVLNLWRILRTEVKINVYTFESCVFSILHERIPHFSPQALSAMFGVATDRDPVAMHTALSYLLRRSQLNQALLHQLDLISRTSELARVFGQDFVAVLTRGSQYRVESMLIRLCKSQNYRLLSATTAQVSSQAAIECIPLVMEPISRFYTSPVLVLDFRSLYPSMMMAHNICFSTCLGKIPTAAAVNNASADGIRSRCGVTNINLPSGFLADHADDIWIAPNGCMFAKDSLRKGVLPRMMYEILRTRESVKQKMKECKQSSNDPALIRLLNARQFGLKLIANVTYGYTAASFSGRMPCVDIADAIVQSARETLETAIRLVEETEKWRATVVYGDTDSLFVLLPGRSLNDAFTIGNDIAETITRAFPAPVKLQFEKVFLPCMLVSKKRYVGYSYETPSQATPNLDAKGIETIRRDQCPLTARLVERSLRLLFSTKDLSRVRTMLEREWHRVESARTPLSDFVFNKEVKLGRYRTPTLPAQAMVAAMAGVADPRAAPLYAERVAFVVRQRGQNARVSDCAMDPRAFLRLPVTEQVINSSYYLENHVLPSLSRLLSLVGVDVNAWYLDRVRPRVLPRPSLPLASRMMAYGVHPSADAGIKWKASHLIESQRATAQPPSSTLKSVSYYSTSNFWTSAAAAPSAHRLLLPHAAHAFRQVTLESFYRPRCCPACLQTEIIQGAQHSATSTVLRAVDQVEHLICSNCKSLKSSADNVADRAAAVAFRARHVERAVVDCSRTCAACINVPVHRSVDLIAACDSLDCPVYFARVKAQQHVRAAWQYQW